MYDIVGKRNWYFAFSALITIPGLIFIALGGLRPSIDFTGGTEWEAQYADPPTAAEMSAALDDLGHPDALVTDLGDGFLRIRTEPIDLAPPPTPVPVATETASASPSETALPSPTASPTAAPTGARSRRGSGKDRCEAWGR